jgi:hypothetical protein
MIDVQAGKRALPLRSVRNGISFNLIEIVGKSSLLISSLLIKTAKESEFERSFKRKSFIFQLFFFSNLIGQVT